MAELHTEPTSAARISRSRRVLMVTGIFPPHSVVGIVRSVKFCKYLPEFGWNVEVLAYRPRSWGEDLDESLVADLPPGLTVHRTGWIDPMALPAKIRALRKRPLVRGAAQGVASAPGVAENRDRHGSKLYRFLRKSPDNLAPWIPFGILGGLAAARRCDAIYSSVPPFSVHMVAHALHRLTRRPLVADFRDPWIGNEALDAVWPWHLRWHERKEAQVVESASAVINVTTELQDFMIARYPNEPRDKFATIFNGVDEADLPRDVAPLDRTNPAEPLTFAYFGSLYGSRTPIPLFDAIRRVLDSGSLKADDIRVRLVGPCRMDVAAEVQRYRLGHIVELVEKKTRAVALREMGQAGVLLQIGAMDMDGHSLSTKIFEYLAIGRPILAMVPEGPIAGLIRRVNAGTVASPIEPDAVGREIVAYVAQHRRGGIPRNPPCDLSPFTRRHQAGELAALLDRAVGANPTRHG